MRSCLKLNKDVETNVNLVIDRIIKYTVFLKAMQKAFQLIEIPKDYLKGESSICGTTKLSVTTSYN